MYTIKSTYVCIWNISLHITLDSRSISVSLEYLRILVDTNASQCMAILSGKHVRFPTYPIVGVRMGSSSPSLVVRPGISTFPADKRVGMLSTYRRRTCFKHPNRRVVSENKSLRGSISSNLSPSILPTHKSLVPAFSGGFHLQCKRHTTKKPSPNLGNVLSQAADCAPSRAAARTRSTQSPQMLRLIQFDPIRSCHWFDDQQCWVIDHVAPVLMTVRSTICRRMLTVHHTGIFE